MRRLAALLALALGCGRAEPSMRGAEARDARDARAAVTVVPLRAPRPASLAPSIYDLATPLRDARGATVGLDVARGQPVLITMFYASCPVACPMLVEELRKTLAEIGRDDVRVLLVSFDPTRDTPEVLRDIARARDLDARWTVAAAASDDAARELAAVLGVKYRRLENGEFVHGSTIVALDEGGRPIARSDALGERAAIVAALR